MRKRGAIWDVVKELGEDTKMQRRLRAAFGAADSLPGMANHLQASDTVYLVCSLLEYRTSSCGMSKAPIATAIYNGYMLLGDIVEQFGNSRMQLQLSLVDDIMPDGAQYDPPRYQQLDKDIRNLDRSALPAARMIAKALVVAKRSSDPSAAHIIHWPIQIIADQVGTQHSEAIANLAADYFRTSLELFEV